MIHSRPLDAVPLWMLAAGLLLLFLGTVRIGRWLRARRELDAKVGESSVVLSASLGLLALLVGFTISMAVSRHEMRRAALVSEANAIGGFLLRLDMVAPDLRRELLVELDRYTDARVRVSAIGKRSADVAEARSVSLEAVPPIWSKVMQAREQTPDTAARILLVESANAMIDAGSTRDELLGARLPAPLLWLLLLFPLATAGLLGYAYGASPGVHGPASTEMMLLLTLTLVLIVDLDRPRTGLILVNQAAMVDVKKQVREAAILAAGSGTKPMDAAGQ